MKFSSKELTFGLHDDYSNLVDKIIRVFFILVKCVISIKSNFYKSKIKNSKMTKIFTPNAIPEVLYILYRYRLVYLDHP